MARSAYTKPANGPTPARSARSSTLLVGLLAVGAVCLTLVWFSFSTLGARKASHGIDIQTHDMTPITATARGPAAGEKLLILTPLKDAEPWLDEYFENLGRLSYPRNLISLAFLVSDSTDRTIAKLQNRARRLSQLPKDEQYDSITILQKDFHFNLAAEVRHGFEGQPVRRAFIAKARNYLLSAALRWDHAWVLWLDVDVVRYDPHILEDLMSIDKDVTVPNTLWHLPQSWDFWVRPRALFARAECKLTFPSCAQGFDRNNFAETEESLALLQKLGPDVMLVEGARYCFLALLTLH